MSASLVFQATRGEATVTITEVARRIGVSKATVCRRCGTEPAWQACAVMGPTGQRVRAISIPKAVESGAAVYGEVSASDTARALLKALRQDPALRLEIAGALLGIAP